LLSTSTLCADRFQSGLATKKLGDVGAGGRREIRGKRIHDLLDLCVGVANRGSIDHDISRERELLVDTRDEGVSSDLAAVNPDSAAVSLAVLVRDGQFDESIVLRKDTGVDSGCRTRERIRNRVDGQGLRI